MNLILHFQTATVDDGSQTKTAQNGSRQISQQRQTIQRLPGTMSATPETSSSLPISSSSSVTILITGASRGFGSAVAKVACRHECFANNLRIVLVARSENGLIATKEECLKITTTKNISITYHTIDLQNLDELDSNLDVFLQDLQIENCNHAILVNNAGTIGHLGPCRASPSLKEMRENVDLNITSSLWMSTRFARYVKGFEGTTSTIVNISSLCAIANFPTFGIYSAGKAARDKYHTLIAKEEGGSSNGDKSDNDNNKEAMKPNLRTLNYAPGPLETEMVSEIRAASALDETLKPAFKGKQLDPVDSATKVIKLLISGNFESGAHIDYYDLP